MSSLALVQPRLFLGLKTTFKNNAQFVTDDDIIYPVEAVLVVHNINQKRQKYIRLAEKGKNVTEFLVSPNNKLIAVVESGSKPTVTLYCPITFKKKKQITVPSDRDCFANKFTAVAFTFDSKFIICTTEDPDSTMYYFRVDRGKLESCTKANYSNNTGIVRQIACNPNDVNVVAMVGDNLIRLMACNDLVWRQFGYSRGEQWMLPCATWLSQERLLVGSSDGRFLVIENGDLKGVFWAGNLPILNLKFKDDVQQQSSQTSVGAQSVYDIPGEDCQIRNLISFPRGFAFAYLYGTIHLYEMETPQKYVKRNVFKLPDHTIVQEYKQDTSSEKMIAVKSITINPSQDRLMVTCNETQLYYVTLWMQDMNSNPELMMTELGFKLHHGPIGDMAACLWKPILLTSGQTDRTLKIWNFETVELEVIQKYEDDIFGISLHPTGQYALVGFSDKLRFLTVMIDEFLITREFPIRTCRQCSFSTLGYLFAAANGNVIQVYSSVTFEMMYTLKGHSGNILDMSWSKDDKKMSSCGNDGAVYEWLVAENKRSSEIIIKQLVFNGVSITSDGKSTYCVSNDGRLREIINSNIYRDVTITHSGLDAIILSNIDLMLFVSGNMGSVFSIKLPILERAEYMEFTMHSSPVSKMLVTFDDRFLITGSTEGSICIWRLMNTEGKAIKMDKDYKTSEEILISRNILEEKLTQINDLKLRLKEMETEFDYQMRQNDVLNSLRMKDIHSEYCNAIEELKEKNENLEAEHVTEIQNIHSDIQDMKKEHEMFVQELEATYNEKLIFEYEKYLRLDEKLEKMRQMYEKQLEDLKLAKTESEENITNDFLEQLLQKQMDFEDMMEKNREKAIADEMIKQQIEEDADREIYELKTKHSKELKEEQDFNVKIRGETAIAKKKVITFQKEVDEFKHQVNQLNNEHVKFKKNIIGLEKDISDLKKEIAERDSTIQDKEKRIYDLKHKNQELDKFKFILEFKIKELKTQIEPREKTIEEQSLTINEMVRELENLQKVILNLDVQLQELRDKLLSSEQEVRRQVNRNIVMKRALNKIKVEIYQASRFIQDPPKLCVVVREMYHKFNTDKDFEVVQAEDTEAKSEFMRQREFLERTVAILQQQQSKSDAYTSDRVKLVNENVVLLTETNMLRRKLKDELKENHKLNSFLGMTKNVLPKVAQEKIRKATATREEIHNSYKRRIEENAKAIDALSEENSRLTNELINIYREEIEDENVV